MILFRNKLAYILPVPHIRLSKYISGADKQRKRSHERLNV